MTKVEVREIDSDECAQWDNLVSDSPQGTVFHRSDWIRTCAALLHKRPMMLGYFEDEELVGGCSLYVSDINRLLTFCKSTASTTPYGGYLLPRITSTRIREMESRNRSIIVAISDEIVKAGFTYTNIINAPAFHDIRPLTWNNWTGRVYYTYMLSLQGDIASNISKKARNAIRKGERQEIRIRRYNDPEVFWNLNVDTYEKQNRQPPFSRTFLMGMLDMVIEKKFGEMWLAETVTGEAASAEVVTWDNHMAHRWSGASSFAHKSTGATSILLYEIFRELQKRGLDKMNLMAANTPHLSMFISGFNPDLIPYFGVEKNRFLSQAARSSNRLWNRMKGITDRGALAVREEDS